MIRNLGCQDVLAQQRLHVGDMMVDKLTAKNAGIEYIHALYGYSSNKIRHKNTIHSFTELISKKL